MHRATFVALCALLAAACTSGAGNGSATANLKSRSGTQVTGTATFTERDGKVDVVLNGEALPEGTHGVYIHEIGDCSGSNASAVGKRFTPGGDERGGVLGEIEAGKNGDGSLIATVAKATVSPGDNSVMGRSIVISSDPDNPQLKETFGIIACGIIGPPES